MEEGLVPTIIVLALAAGVLGGHDALRALLDLAGRSPVLDIAICVFVIGLFASQLLGAVLLARFVRKPPRSRPRGARGAGAPRPRAPAAGCLLASMTLTVSVGVAVVVAACLVAVPGGGDLMSSVHLAFDFAGNGKGPVVAAAGFLLLLCFTQPLLRGLRAAGHAHGAARAATATRWTVCLAALPLPGICLLLVANFAARGGRDALRHFSAGSTNKFTGVAAFAVAGTALLTRLFRRAGNGAGAAPPLTANTAARSAKLRRFTMKLTSVSVVCFSIAYFLFLAGMSGSKSDGGEHAACSVPVTPVP